MDAEVGIPPLPIVLERWGIVAATWRDDTGQRESSHGALITFACQLHI
jgi:hypothetical protein